MDKDEIDEVDAYRKFEARQSQLATRKHRIMILFFLLVLALLPISDRYFGGEFTVAFGIALASYLLGYWYSETDSTMQREHQEWIRDS